MRINSESHAVKFCVLMCLNPTSSEAVQYVQSLQTSDHVINWGREESGRSNWVKTDGPKAQKLKGAPTFGAVRFPLFGSATFPRL